MSNKIYISAAGLIGIATGWLTIHSPLEHSWMSMILWVVAGSAILHFSRDKRTAMIAGSSFGFCTIAVWLISGFQGTSNQLTGFSVMVIVLSLLGALCGLIGALLYYYLFQRIH